MTFHGFHDHGALQVSFAFTSFSLSSSSRLKLTRILLSSGKRCNKLPIPTDTEEERTKKVFKKIRLGGYFDVPIILRSRTFCRFFAPGRAEMLISDGDDNKSGDGTSSSDVGEYCHL